MVLLAIYHTTTGFVLRSILILASEAGGLSYSRLARPVTASIITKADALKKPPQLMVINRGSCPNATASVNILTELIFIRNRLD
jgi:hypothetical protein